jgi:hypothetical protein
MSVDIDLTTMNNNAIKGNSADNTTVVFVLIFRFFTPLIVSHIMIPALRIFDINPHIGT